MNCNCVNPKPKCSEVNGITIVTIPGSLGDDSQGSIYAPTIGAYKNAVVKYLANGYVYVYDKDGAYTMIGDSDAVDIEVDQILNVKSKNAIANQAVSKALVKLTETVAKDYTELSGKTAELGEKIETLDGSLAKVAKTGDYKDLLNQPVVDTALSTASRNAVENRAITTAINAEKAARESADAGIRSDVTTIDTAINKDVVTDIKLDPTPSTTIVNLDATKTNIKTSTSTTSSFPLPVASSTQAGVINSATYNSIREAIQIEQAVVHGAVAITGLPMSPTQQDITDAWKNATGLTDLVNRAEVYDVSHNKVWTYYENDTTWHATSSTTQVTVQQFTNSSLGTIKGSTIDGQIYAETNGTGSVNGWDTLSATVSSSKSKLDTIEQGAEVNVQANWNQTTTTADDYIKNKPNLSTVATSGSYDDLTDKPIDSNTDVGNNINPIFVKDGILTASAGNVGNKFKPTYMANGNITASDATVGGSKTPVYMNAGTVTAMDELADVAFSGDYNDLKNNPGGGGSDTGITTKHNTYSDGDNKTDYWITYIPRVRPDGKINELKQHLVGQDGQTLNGAVARPASVARNNGFKVCINSATFIQEAGEERYKTNNKYLIQDGVQIPTNGTRTNLLCIMDDGTLKHYDAEEMTAQELIDAGVKYSLTAFWTVIEDGVITAEIQSKEDWSTLYQRQVIAQDAEKNIYIFTCDGKDENGGNYSVGMSMEQVANLLLNTYHVTFAFMLDGGGSTSTVIDGTVINQVSDNINRDERYVPFMLYVEDTKHQSMIDSQNAIGQEIDYLKKEIWDTSYCVRLSNDITATAEAQSNRTVMKYRLGGSRYTGNDLPNNNFKYSTAEVIARDDGDRIIKVYGDKNTNQKIAIKYCAGGVWSNWRFIGETNTDTLSLTSTYGTITNDTKTHVTNDVASVALILNLSSAVSANNVVISGLKGSRISNVPVMAWDNNNSSVVYFKLTYDGTIVATSTIPSNASLRFNFTYLTK